MKINATLGLYTQNYESQCARCGPDGTPSTYPGCAYVVVAQVSPIAGAVSYRVLLKDNRIGDRTLTGPPFSTANDYNIPLPATSWGLTAGNGPPPCPSDPTLNGRFVIGEATATGNICAPVAGQTAGSAAFRGPIAHAAGYWFSPTTARTINQVGCAHTLAGAGLGAAALTRPIRGCPPQRRR